MTNILLLPQLTGMTVSLANNGGWYDSLWFSNPSNTGPLDLTGIAFHGEIRTSAADPSNRCDLSTAAGTILNFGKTGQLQFNAPASLFLTLSPSVYVFDLLAIDASVTPAITLNLFQQGPATITMLQGVTR